MPDYLDTRTIPLHESWKEREAREAVVAKLRRDAVAAGVPVAQIMRQVHNLNPNPTINPNPINHANINPEISTRCRS